MVATRSGFIAGLTIVVVLGCGGKADGPPLEMGGATSAQGGAAGGRTSAATGGIGPGSGRGGAASGGAAEATSGAPAGGATSASCTPGADQTCNDSPAVSSIWGTCRADGSCVCNAGRELNPDTGRCRVVTSDCYSPEENLYSAYDDGAIGCPCDDARDVSVCRRNSRGVDVALVCEAKRWQSAEDGPCSPGVCSLTRRVELSSEVSLISELKVTPSAGDFALVGFGVGDWVAAASASWHGLLTEQRISPGLDIVLGAGLLRGAGGEEQLIVIDRGLDAVGKGLRATAWERGTGEALASTRLFEHEYFGQASRFAAQSSRDGTRVLFAFGNQEVDADITISVIGRNAELLGAPSRSFALAGKHWGCMRLLPTQSGGLLSVIAQSDTNAEFVWQSLELDANGEVTSEVSVALPLAVSIDPQRCPLVSHGIDDGAIASRDSEGVMHVVTMKHGTTVAEVPFSVGDSINGFGQFGTGFVFLRRTDDRFYVHRVDADGAAFPVQYQLEDPAASAAELIAIDGSALTVSYFTDSARVIEEITCR
jgi:hypothetical protein